MELPYQLSNCSDTNDLYKIVTEIRVIDKAVISKLQLDCIHAHLSVGRARGDPEAQVSAAARALQIGAITNKYRNRFQNQSFYGIDLDHKYIREKANLVFPPKKPAPPAPKVIENVQYEDDYNSPSPPPSDEEVECVRSVTYLDSSPEQSDRRVTWTNESQHQHSKKKSEKPKLKSVVKRVKPQALVRPRLKSVVKKLF